MINPVMRGLVKIGLTKRTAYIRAKEIRGSGVPDDFTVVYDELVADCVAVERRLHRRFDRYRYLNNREFFQLPVKEAIRGLIEESSDLIVPQVGMRGGIEILADLKRKYPSYLKPDFHSIKIVHSGEVVYLESARYPYKGLRDEIIERIDLGFINEDEVGMFQASRLPSDNARIFIHQLDEFSMLNCADLFTAEACKEIVARYELSCE